ncbi:MAG: hypothetical protein MIO93_13070 [ANME-2 cluster archaeon]|nr:hypothetical protein [ANME-2 cluster archaeon]
MKFMYIYTIILAGGLGLAMIIAPNMMISQLGMHSQDPIIYGIAGSVYVAFGLLSILGLRSPLKFVPILLLQLCYKAIWFIGVALPLVVMGQFPTYAIVFAVIFATYIIGDIIAIPFSYIFAKQSE